MLGVRSRRLHLYGSDAFLQYPYVICWPQTPSPFLVRYFFRRSSQIIMGACLWRISGAASALLPFGVGTTIRGLALGVKLSDFTCRFPCPHYMIFFLCIASRVSPLGYGIPTRAYNSPCRLQGRRQLVCLCARRHFDLRSRTWC